MPPHTSCCYRCPICSRGVVGTREAVITIGIVQRFRGNVLVSEQANVDCAAGFGVRLIGCADDAALPIGMHDYAEALGCCTLVDKTMFIADVLDCDASVVVCCRPEGFGKSMNLSTLRAFLERPAAGRSGQRLFANAQIWDADGGRYRDEYACYPVISLDFSGAARRGAAIADVVRDALSGECARLLALLEAPDLARDKVRHIERVARGVASADEVDSVLGVCSLSCWRWPAMSRLYCSLMGTMRRGLAVRARGTLPTPIRQGYSIACCSTPLPLRAIRCG